MVISRRYSKRAVDRNRARRLLREAYRTLFPRLQPAWMVLIPRHGMRQVKLSPVLAEIERLLDGLGGLRKEGAGV
jgi:ribonuclease P protein component